jgi:hypothetical protein
MSGRDEQPARVAIGKGARQFADVVGIPKDTLGDHQQLLARLGHAEQTLAIAMKRASPSSSSTRECGG